MSSEPRLCSLQPKVYRMRSSPLVWTRRGRLLASGASDLLWSACPVLRNNLAAGVQPGFPPSLVVQVKALACELPQRLGMPLSRLAIADIKREVIGQGLVANISGATLWRWLSTDALRPWQQRSWIFPRDPQLALKAGRILDFYERVWDGQPLQPEDFVISADEKTSIQARRRKQPTLPPACGRPMRVEHEYFREGACMYFAAWDVHRAKIFGRCEPKNGIAPVDRLVGAVMAQEPYRSANASFGSWTTALRIAVRKRLSDCAPSGPMLTLCIHPSMPVGSIKSRSISQSFKERYSPLTTSPPWPNSKHDCWLFNATMNRLLPPSNGLSRAKIS